MTEVSSPPEYASTTLSMSPFITFPVVPGQPTPRSIGEGVTATRAATGMTSPSRCYVHRSAISARADARDLRDQGDGGPTDRPRRRIHRLTLLVRLQPLSSYCLRPLVSPPGSTPGCDPLQKGLKHFRRIAFAETRELQIEPLVDQGAIVDLKIVAAVIVDQEGIDGQRSARDPTPYERVAAQRVHRDAIAEHIPAHRRTINLGPPGRCEADR